MFTNDTKARCKLMLPMFGAGAALDAIIYGTLAFGIKKKRWKPFLAALPLTFIGAGALVRYYYNRVSYICPMCDETFKPRFAEFLFAKHTLHTRDLTCTLCGHVGTAREVIDHVE